MDRPLGMIDTHLLRVLHTLLLERSVTRSAVRLNHTQPAISAALRRLRALFGDELLVRSGNAMVPTQRGLALQRPVRVVLEELDRMFTADAAFVPRTTQMTFAIGCPDYLATVYVAEVVARLRREAPSARLSIHPLGPDFQFERAMADGELDVVIGNWPEPPPNLHIVPLLTDDIVCLVARDHPLAARAMTRAQYLEAPHVVPQPFSATHRGVIDQHLARLKLTRNARVTVPFFSMAPHMLVGTDLIFTISRHFASYYASFLPLVVVPCPIDYPPMRFYQLWHERSHASQAHLWLRRMLVDAAGELRLTAKPAANGARAGRAVAGIARRSRRSPGEKDAAT